MFSQIKEDGTEGMAAVEMTYKEKGKTRKLVMHGCFVRNDKNLQSFIEEAFKQSTDREKLADCKKLFFYTCESELVEKSDKITKISCEYHFTKPDKVKKSVTLSYSSNEIFKVQEHIFLFCDFETKKNDSKFLTKYCKKFSVPDKDLKDSTIQIHCLSCAQEGKPKLIPLRVTNHHSSANVFGIEKGFYKEYKQIEDTGPVLFDDGKSLVGSYRKTSDNDITLSLFGNSQDRENEDHSKGSGSEEKNFEEKNQEQSQQLEELKDQKVDLDRKNIKLEQGHDDKSMSEEKVGIPSEETTVGADKQEKPGQKPCPGSEETNINPDEKQTIKHSHSIRQPTGTSSCEGSVEPQALAKNVTLEPQEDAVDSVEGDVSLEKDSSEHAVDHVSIQETGPGADPLEEMKHSLRNGQLNDRLAQNREKYQRSLLYLARNASEHWREIGRNLDIKDNILSNLEANNKSEGVEEIAYQMLIQSVESNRNLTLEKLLNALINSECVETAETLTEKLREDCRRSHVAGIPVKENLLQEIAYSVKDKWKFLGRYLGLDDGTIHAIKMDNPDSTREQTHQMLLKWKQKNGSNATCRALKNALEDVGKSNVAKTVEEWERK